jgi:hypothetical protein
VSRDAESDSRIPVTIRATSSNTMAERIGDLVFNVLWSYVKALVVRICM